MLAILDATVQAHASEDIGHDHATPLFDGPVKPIERNVNRWRPTLDTSVLLATEKKVKRILNKMTKTNYERLSQQICDMIIPSYEVLSMIISRVYEKAIDEPFFGHTYADLCMRLSKNVNPDSFVHIRWSSNMGTRDYKVFGPFASEEECIDVAFIEDSEAPKPTHRGEMELILVKAIIVEGIFLKVMRTQQQEQSSEEAEPAPRCSLYFFPWRMQKFVGSYFQNRLNRKRSAEKMPGENGIVLRNLS